MVTVKFIRDDGKEFLIDNVTWKIPSDGLVGFDSVPHEIKTQANAQMDGSKLQSKRVAEKDRTVKAVLVNRNLNSTMREIVQRFFGVKRDFKVYVNYNGNEKYCEGSLYAFSMPTENIYGFITMEVTILSPQPYLLSVDEFGKNIGGLEGGLEFDFEIPEEGIEFDRFAFAQEVDISNDGDVDTFMRAVMIAKGEVVNPTLKKGDYFIRILDTMQDGDVIEIDFVKTPPTVKKNGVNIIGKTTRDSNFKDMVLSIGTNTIGYEADTGDTALDVYIYYNKRYGGM